MKVQLSQNVIPYLQPQVFNYRTSVNDLLNREVKKFTDVLYMYIRVLEYLKNIWYGSLWYEFENKLDNKKIRVDSTNEEIREIYLQYTFNKKELDRIFLSKGSNIKQEVFQKQALLEAARLLEEYVVKFLNDSPKYQHFAWFEELDYKMLDEVFDPLKTGIEEQVLFTYELDWKINFIKQRSQTRALSWRELDAIVEWFSGGDKVILKDLHLDFNRKKKLITLAAEYKNKWIDWKNNSEVKELLKLSNINKEKKVLESKK